MCADVLREFRAAIDGAAAADRAAFARRARNAAAKAVVDAALGANAEAATRPPPAEDVHAHVGPELADALLTVYAGGEDWTASAIDVIEPLHALARPPRRRADA